MDCNSQKAPSFSPYLYTGQGIRAQYHESVKVTHESSNSGEKLGLHGLLFGEAAANEYRIVRDLRRDVVS